VPGSSLLCRRVLVALMLATAWVSAGGSLIGAAAAAPSGYPTGGAADSARPRAAAATPSSTTSGNVRWYTVRSGDCLTTIAARHRYPGGWPRLYAHNRRTVGHDPDLIYPGQRLRLVLRQPARSSSPTPRRAAVTNPKALTAAAQPVEPAARPAGPRGAPEPVPSARSRWQAALRWVVPALGLLFAVSFALSLVLATIAGDPRRERRRLPAAQTPAAPDPTLVPDPNPASQPPPAPAAHPPVGPGPTPATGQEPVSFSLVVVADGDGGADPVAPLVQAAALADRRLQIVVVVGQDDRVARALAEAFRGLLPDRVTVVSGGQRPLTLTAAIDRALPACQGEVTGVLAAGPIHRDLLDRVAGHVRHDRATMVWAATQSAACRWSTSKPPDLFGHRLVPIAGRHVFVRTELLPLHTVPDVKPAADPRQPGNGIHGQPVDARRRRATVQLATTGHRVIPDQDLPVVEHRRRSGAI
jgi:LysM domain-containing protein